MKFIKVITTDNEVEFLNLEKVLSIKPMKNGTVKILMGAGLYWSVFPFSIEEMGSEEELYINIEKELY